MLRRLSPAMAFFSLYFIWILTHLISEENGDIYIGHANVWGDWAAHFTYTMHFVVQSAGDWFSKNPIFAGEKLHYPFLINSFSAVLVRAGLGISNALRFTSLAAMLGAVFLLHRFYRNLLDRKGADLALFILFFGGSLGWIFYFRDLFSGTNLLETIFFPPFEYGHLPDSGLDVGGTLTCLWLPQRALPLAVVAVAPLLVTLTAEKIPSKARQLGAGFIAGLLPIIHVHTLICVSGLLFCFVVEKRKTVKSFAPALASFFVTAGVLWLLYHHDSPSGSFLKFQPWWIAGNEGTIANKMGWLLFWLWNWSVFLPLVVLGFWIRSIEKKFVLAAGLCIFLVANFVRFQPWDWDNTKLFFWAYLLMTPTAVRSLHKIMTWRWGKITTTICLFVLLFTGALEGLRFFSPSRMHYLFFSAEERAWAKRLDDQIPKNAVVLSSGDAHDWVSALAGRQVVKGYSGWLWSYGLPEAAREQQIRNFFSASPGGDVLLKNLSVTHVVVDNKTRALFEVNPKSLIGLKTLWSENGVSVFEVAKTPFLPPR